MIETTANNLRAALRAVAPAIDRRASVPILGCVKFSDGTIVGTNMDMEIEAAMPTTRAEAPLVVDYRATSRLVAGIDLDEMVSIGGEKRSAVIAFNGSEYRLPSMGAEDWPTLRSDAMAHRAEAGNNNLLAAIKAALPFASTEETRYYLNGVSFASRDGAQYAAATNGHMLAMRKLAAPIDWLSGKIIFRPTCSALAGLKGEPAAVEMDEAGRQLHFQGAGIKIRSKLIDGTFPDVWRVIPQEPEHAFRVNRTALRAALRRLAAVSRVAVKITITHEAIEISVKMDETEGRETVKAEGRAGGEIGFNRAYLEAICNHFAAADDLLFTSSAAGKSEFPSHPVLIRDPERPDDGFVVLMPMRV